MRYFGWKLISLLLLGCFGCKQEGDVVVSVYDQSLTVNQLAEMTPVFDAQSDSLLIRRQYVDAWVLRQVMLYEAEKNLTSNEKKFDKQVEDYRNSLLIYAYQNKMIEKRLKKDISDQEMEDYYNQNKEKFRLRRPIIKINYVKLPLKSRYVQQIKPILFAEKLTNQDMITLSQICHQYAVNYYLSDDWLLFDDILKEVPMQNFGEDDFKKEKTQMEFKDSAYLYLVRVKDFQLNQGYSPLSIQKNEVEYQILQQRRMKIWEELKAENLQKAKKANEIIY
jgi:hypothetical protein